MGHQDVKTTLVYARLVEGDIEGECEIGLFTTSTKSQSETTEVIQPTPNHYVNESFVQTKEPDYDPAYV